LTGFEGGLSFIEMQVTLDIPEQVAERIGKSPNELAELIESGFRIRNWTGESGVARELVNFLASGPSPKAIVAFHPSEESALRVRGLLDKNRAGHLTLAERAELDEMALLDQFMSLLKARGFEECTNAAR
jgi:hypothetical protein